MLPVACRINKSPVPLKLFMTFWLGLFMGMGLLSVAPQTFAGSKLDDGGAKSGVLPAVIFSHPSGFYPETFHLQMSVPYPEAEIRYTLDGSVPHEDSPVYQEHIRIYDRTAETPLISLIPTGHNWQPPAGTMPRAMVVRARAFIEGYLPGPVKSATFFINEQQSFSHALSVISIFTNKENLFDDDIGIYVIGNAPGGNFHQRGDEWERPAFMELFDTQGHTEYAGGVGLRIHGGTSRNFPQKSLRLYFRNAYGDSWMQHELFPSYPVKQFKRLILRQSGHDMQYTFIRDAFMQSLLVNTHQDLQAHRPAVVYINGEYWGMHNIRERYDKYYIQSHHGAEPENLDMLGHTNLHITQGDREHYEEMLGFIRDNGLQEDQNLQHLTTLMDVDSYTDYKIAEIFFYRWDIGNIRHWRERTPEGRWRWMMFDLDTGFGGFWSWEQPWTFDMMVYNTEPNGPWTGYLGHEHNSPNATFLLRRLLENETYRRQFILRFADLLNTNFHPDFALHTMDSLSRLIRSEIPLQSSRWHAIPSAQTWEEELEVLRQFAQLRPRFQRQHLLDFFNLSDTLSLTFDVSNQLAGHIRVNSIAIVPTTPGVEKYPYPWQGVYFAGVPMQAEAIAAPGYEFSHWEGSKTGNEALLKFTPENDIKLMAVFHKIQQPVLLHYWLFDTSLPNDTPLESLETSFSLLPGGLLAFQSAYPQYPYYPGHLFWRRASMERRNLPTALNYRSSANNDIPYESAAMRGVQIRQPFQFQDRESQLVLHLPTTGFHKAVLRFAAINEGAARDIIIEYNRGRGEERWEKAGLTHPLMPLENQYRLYEVDFANIPFATNNPDFKVRLRFSAPMPEQDDGERVTFNNISLDALPMDVFTVFSSAQQGGKIQPRGFVPVYEGGQISFSIQPDNGYSLQDIHLDGTSLLHTATILADSSVRIDLTDIRNSHQLNVSFEKVAPEETASKDALLLFPNPTSGKLTISCEYSMEHISISNIAGQVMLSQPIGAVRVYQTDISFLPAGFYLVSVRGEYGIFTRKLKLMR